MDLLVSETSELGRARSGITGCRAPGRALSPQPSSARLDFTEWQARGSLTVRPAQCVYGRLSADSAWSLHLTPISFSFHSWSFLIYCVIIVGVHHVFWSLLSVLDAFLSESGRH